MLADSRVQAVVLVGSRAAGTATELSDWDYLIVSADPGAIASQLPRSGRGTEPMSATVGPDGQHAGLHDHSPGCGES